MEAERDQLRAEVERLKESHGFVEASATARAKALDVALLQIDVYKDALKRAKRLLSVCSFDAKEDVADLDFISDVK
jgi:hypothetical protein